MHAHVDDVLVRRHVLAQRLRRLLGPHDLASLTLREYRGLLGEVRRLPFEVQPVLQRLASTLSAPQGELAAELLSDLEQGPAPTEAPPVAGARVIDLYPDVSDTPAFQQIPPSSELLFQAAADSQIGAEEMALLWLEQFLGQPREVRFPILIELLGQCSHRCGPLLRVEWHAGDLAGDPALTQLFEKHFKMRQPPWLGYPRGGEPAMPPVAREAWIAAVDGTGHLVVVLNRPAADGRNTFAVHLLDLWRQGIEDAWGNARSDSRTLTAVLANFRELEPQVSWREIDAPHAAALVQQAHAFNEQSCTLVPPEFWVWSDLSAAPVSTPPALKRLWRPRRRASQ